MNTPLKPKIVLVADRTLSADYTILFEGIFSTMQTTQVPDWAMRRLIAPPAPVDRKGRALQAPIGLRRVESSILASMDLSEDDVVCATPESLPALLGPWVELVGVSSSDPLGMGMTNTTTMHFWKGELYTKVWMARMMERLLEAKRKHGFRIIGGGAGAWQWIQQPDEAWRQGFDYIFSGYFEDNGAQWMQEILNGGEPERIVTGHNPAVDKIEPMRGASTLGVTEISRGCGKGCRFCTMAGHPMQHLEPQAIYQDLETNARHGMTSIVSASEDFFRYGGIGNRVNFERLRSLLEGMRKLPDLSFIQIDHANISSVLQYSLEQLKEIRRLLQWRQPTDYLWVNMGVESANGALVAANGRGKMFNPDDWENMVYEAVERLNASGFFPVLSLVLGLPGETPDDVQRTLSMARTLQTKKTLLFPVFYEPVLSQEESDKERFRFDSMSSTQLELYTTCYETNFNWVPKLYWDNQRAGGVPWLKRSAIQLVGRGEIQTWRSHFRKARTRIALREKAA